MEKNIIINNMKFLKDLNKKLDVVYVDIINIPAH